MTIKLNIELEADNAYYDKPEDVTILLDELMEQNFIKVKKAKVLEIK